MHGRFFVEFAFLNALNIYRVDVLSRSRKKSTLLRALRTSSSVTTASSSLLWSKARSLSSTPSMARSFDGFLMAPLREGCPWRQPSRRTTNTSCKVRQSVSQLNRGPYYIYFCLLRCLSSSQYVFLRFFVSHTILSRPRRTHTLSLLNP